MIEYMFMPMEENFDSGFGALGSVFHDAGEQLGKNEEFGDLFNRRLPICYLHRHAIELFLKSAIIIIHRKYEVSPEERREALPEIPGNNGKAKRVDKIHSIEALFLHLRTLFEKHNVQLPKTDGSPYQWPTGTCDAIKVIERFDSCSDFFRYPVSRGIGDDKVKSSMKPVSTDELPGKIQNDPSQVHCFVLDDGDGNPVEASEHENEAVKTLEGNLTCVAGFLSDLHAAMRALLTGGS